MVSQWIRVIVFPFISVFIIFSSYVLAKTPHVLYLSAVGILLIVSVIFEFRLRSLRYLQIPLLLLFHWLSHLNWSELLYIILVILSLEKKLQPKQMIHISIGYSFLYTIIRLTYLPITKYNLLVSIYDLLSFIFIAISVRYILSTELEKRRLLKNNKFLTTHDPLTGLLNFESYTNTVKQLVSEKKTEFVLLLLDFQDFKSVNNVSIQNGNEILTNIAVILKAYFPHAIAIARYAGDRFALVIPQKEDVVAAILYLLESKSIGYEVTYSITLFPEEASDNQDILTLAEDRLFQKKRKLWLKREEEMLRSEKLMIVGELAAGMAHEIRNPLTTMHGFMQLSKSHDYNIKPWFDIIMDEITRMTELTAEFLQFSKPHIGNMKPESISNCLSRVLSLTESQAISKGHTLTFEPVDKSLMVLMERDKIVQVLLNIIRNAMEAMEQPGFIGIRVKKVKDELIIEIEDSGPGISENELSRIFTPFYTTKDNGTGLGLSICHKIVQDHGGSMSVQSIVQIGSTFIVKLPLYSGNETKKDA